MRKAPVLVCVVLASLAAMGAGLCAIFLLQRPLVARSSRDTMV